MRRLAILAAMLPVLAASSARAQTVRDFFRMAPCAEGVSLRPAAYRQVVVDEPNGYLQVTETDEAGEVVYTFAVFRKADGTRLFACNLWDDGPEDSHGRLEFYRLRGERMQRVEHVAPELDLEDFVAPGALPARRYRAVVLRYILPRVGTTIRVEPWPREDWPAYVEQVQPGHEVSAEELDRYMGIVHHSRYKAIELVWNRELGVFTLGRKIPR